MIQWLAISVVGFGIGILAGLSVSPVLSIILTTIVGAAGTLTALFGRYTTQENIDLPSPSYLVPQPKPLALLITMIVLGAVIGLVFRVELAESQRLSTIQGAELSPPTTLSKSIQAWTDLGLDEQKVANSLFKAYLGMLDTNAKLAAEETSQAMTAGLFSATAEECPTLMNTTNRRLRTELRSSQSDALATIADKVTDLEILRLVVEVACSRRG